LTGQSVALIRKSRKSTIFKQNLTSSLKALDKAEEHKSEEQFFTQTRKFIYLL
jgi:hypothetical protein